MLEDVLHRFLYCHKPLKLPTISPDSETVRSSAYKYPTCSDCVKLPVQLLSSLYKSSHNAPIQCGRYPVFPDISATILPVSPNPANPATGMLPILPMPDFACRKRLMPDQRRKQLSPFPSETPFADRTIRTPFGRAPG